MPQISIFLGIIIKMYYDDHNPPHFHADYGEYKSIVDIQKLDLLEWIFATLGFRSGDIKWAAIHQTELMNNWGKALNHETLIPIKPLV